MKKAVLPNGKQVSSLCFGTLTMGPLQRGLSPQEGSSLLLHAFERGINFIDTAEIYANYEHIGLALKSYRDICVATKCYAYDEAGAKASYEKAVRGIGREYIDVFMLHEQESEHTLRGHAEAIAYFLKKKDEGYIGELGISTHFIAGARAIAKHTELAVLHPIINKAGLGICDGRLAEMEEAVSAAHAAGKFIYAMKPLGGGHLINDRKQAFSYVRALPFIDSIAVGMQTMHEIDYNISLFSDQTITEELAHKTGSRVRTLLIHDWCEGCGACAKACANGALHLENGKMIADQDKCLFCGYCAAKCPQFCIKVI